MTDIAEQAWHALRAKHVGGSETAALFGEHPFLTKFELWHRKIGNLPSPDFSDNSRIFWGQTLEPAVAMGVAKLHNWNIRKIRRYLQHPTVEGFGGSPLMDVIRVATSPAPAGQAAMATP